MKANLAQHLRSVPDANLADIAFTLQTGRSEFVHRHAIVCGTTDQACSLLDSPTPQRVYSGRQDHKDPPVVFMFPGQGAQFAGMGADLYQSEDVFRDVVDRCAESLRPILNQDLRDVLFPRPDQQEEATEKIRQTRFTQPALFVIEYALAQLWMSWGIKPAAMIGHSVGEFVAACLADVMNLDDALRLIARRAELVQSMPPGSMLAVRLPETEITPQLTPSLAIAAVNSPELCVVAGPDESIEDFDKQLSDRGVFTKRLRTSHAFHSHMMDPVIDPFTDVLRGAKLAEPKIPYVSNVTAEWIDTDDAIRPEYWARHVRDAVRFADGIEKLLKDPSQVLLEVGPGRGLTQLAMQHPSRDKSQRVVTSMPYTEQADAPGVIAALGQLWSAGVNVDWQAFYARETRRRVVLPTYPFERTVCWPGTPTRSNQETSAEPVQGQPAEQPPSRVVVAAANGSIAPPTPPVTPQDPPIAPGSPVAAPQPSSVPDVDRKQRLVGEIGEVLEELSGSSISAADTSMNLLEFGFDSLLLTQVATLLRKKFRTKVTFRQLMEDLSTVDAIATYVDANLPPEPEPSEPEPSARQPEEPVATDPVASAPPSSAAIVRTQSPVSANGQAPVSANGQAVDGQNLEAQLQQHLAASAELLHRIRQRPASGAAVAPSTDSSSGLAIAPESVAALTAVTPRATHGPFKSLDDGKVAELTDSQQEKLDEFVARYTQRTATSKKLASENRSILADPRSVAGFKSAWKEAVYPLHTIRSDGSKIWDVDGNEYIDFVMGFGASLFGHRPPFVVEAVKAQLDAGFETGPIHPMAGEVARLVRELTGAERVAFCSTGSEGVLAAIRVARTVTARDKIVIFEGAYHGIFDEVLARPLIRNGELRSMPTAPGIPEGTFGEIIVLQYGNPASLEIIEQYGDDIAAVLVEPIQARRLDLVPSEFLHQLRQITTATGTALVFDEVVTGFRLHPGGAQAHFGIKADLATYGKVVGGGLPIGIVTGKPMFMDALDGGPWQFGDDSAPEVGVTFFAGTFVRHPLALAAAKSVLTHLKQEGPELQIKVAAKGDRVAKAFRELFDRYNAPYHLCSFSSLVYVSVPPEFTYGPLIFCHLRDRGIHIFENRLFVLTTSHSDEDIDRLIDAMEDSLNEMRRGGFLIDDGAPDSFLRNEGAVTLGATSPTRRRGDLGKSEWALTQAQQEIWLAAEIGEDAFRAYNTTYVVSIVGPLDREALQISLQELVDRHDSLRVAFDTSRPIQRYLPEVDLEVPFVDLTTRSSSAREQRCIELARQQADRPFDIDSPPLFRVLLIRLESDVYRLILTASHLVADGWSVGVLLHELKAVYHSRRDDAASRLPAAMQFTEYLRLLEKPEHLAAVQESEQYWREQFSTLPAPLELPSDRRRPLQKTYGCQRASVIWDEELTRSIRKACVEQRTTLLNFLLAGFTSLLRRLTGQEDLVVGIPAAGQISPAMESAAGAQTLVGHCVNLLPVRCHCPGDQSFRTYLSSLKSEILDAYDHQSLTFSRLLELIKVPRELNRVPLVPVMFNVDRTVSGFELEGLDTTVEELGRSSIVFDIFCNIVDDDKELRVDCEFNSDLFDASTIRRWLNYFRDLLAHAAANPETKIDQIELLRDEELQQTLVQWNRTRRDDDSEDCLHRLVERQAMNSPTQSAICCRDQSITYADLESRSNRLAHHLRGLGVRAEVLVAICTERCIDMVVGLLGILKAGGAFVPIDPAFPGDRISVMLEDCDAKLLVTQSTLLHDLPTDGLDVVCLDRDASDWEHGNNDPLPRDESTENLAYVIFTSGSTGRPKGVQIPHRAIVNFLRSMRHTPGLSSDDVLLAVTTLSFDIAMLEIFLPLTTGATVQIASGEAAADAMMLMEEIERSRATVMQATPATWRMLIEAGWQGTPNPNAPSLKVLCGGEALPRDLIDPLLTRSAELWNMYGPTETTVWSSVERITSSDGIVSIGRPIDNTQMYVLDDRRQPVPAGVIGELYIGGDGLARGYLNRPDLTKERFVRDPFGAIHQARLYNTGDLARHLSDGRLECLGRKDGQVKIRGYRIELGEIEAVLSSHPQVHQSVVIQRQFGPGDVRLLAFVVYKPGAAEIPSELQALLREKLPKYMVPSAVISLDELPRTPNGKIDRKPLAELQVDKTRDNEEYAAPSDQIELFLTRLWEHLIDVRPVGVHDDFFDLGGHSLLGVQLMVQIEKTYGKRLPLATLLQTRTIAGLAEIIRLEQWKPKWSSLVPMREAGARSPLFLFHAHGGNVLEYHALVDHLPADRPVYALQARGLDGKIPRQTTIPDMSRRYIQEIRELQPEGPYFLVGYCFGGYLALESACQLEDAGEEVVFLGLIQSMAPEFSRYMHGGNYIAKTYRRTRRRIEIELSELRRVGARSLLNRFTQINDRVRGRWGIWLDAVRRRPRPADRDLSLPEILQRLERAHEEAFQQHSPRRSICPVTLFPAERQLRGVFDDASFGWRDILHQDISIHQVPGIQQTMLKMPHVKVLADKLDRCIRASESLGQSDEQMEDERRLLVENKH